jgi:hypothetical protein
MIGTRGQVYLTEDTWRASTEGPRGRIRTMAANSYLFAMLLFQMSR